MIKKFFWCDIIYSTLYGKANSRKIIVNRRTGKPMVIKQEGALQFVHDFMAQARRPPVPFEGQVSLSGIIYYPNNRQDLEVELLKDCIEKAGILKNDKQITEYKRIIRKLNKDTPRVVFALRQKKGRKVK